MDQAPQQNLEQQVAVAGAPAAVSEGVRVRPGILDLLTNPWVATISAIASIISLPLAVSFFVASQSQREITFFIKTAVVKAGQTSALRVLFGDRYLKRCDGRTDRVLE